MSNENSSSGIVSGVYTYEHIRDGVVIDSWTQPNLVPLEGCNYMLNSSFGGSTAFTSWYIGLFNGNYTPVSTDTGAAFAASASESANYSAGVRQPAVFASSTAASLTNAASLATFTFTAADTIYGSFISSNSAINATTGTLGSATRFPTSRTMAIGDILNVSYAMTLTSS